MAALTLRPAALWNRSIGNQTAVAVIVSVTRPDGTPLTGLTEGDFDLDVIDAPNALHRGTKAGFFEFANPPGGIYSMGTGQPPGPGGHWGQDMLAIIIHAKKGADAGRTVLNVVLG